MSQYHDDIIGPCSMRKLCHDPIAPYMSDKHLLLPNGVVPMRRVPNGRGQFSACQWEAFQLDASQWDASQIDAYIISADILMIN